jgi:hypothetical protein
LAGAQAAGLRQLHSTQPLALRLNPSSQASVQRILGHATGWVPEGHGAHWQVLHPLVSLVKPYGQKIGGQASSGHFVTHFVAVQTHLPSTFRSHVPGTIVPPGQYGAAAETGPHSADVQGGGGVHWQVAQPRESFTLP